MNKDSVQLNNILKEAIVKTIAYFDMFDFPLTDFEIWQYSEVSCELEDVTKILESGMKNIQYQDGFYFLDVRREIIEKRMRRYNYTDRKIKRVKFLCRIFRFIPWINLVAIGNLVGQHNLRDEGDIDMFVITQKKRIWISRFFCVVITKILGWRPTKEDSRDKICLSFFISEDKLDLFNLRLDGEDIYFRYWLAGLLPIYDSRNYYEQFMNANKWLKQELPNLVYRTISSRIIIKPIMSRYAKEIIDLFIGGLEPQFKNWQMKIMPLDLKNLANKGTDVIIKDNILKFHDNDRRKYYQIRHKEKIKELLGSFDENIKNLLGDFSDEENI